MSIMDNVYQPKEVEKKWYSFWEKEGLFQPKIEPKKKPFVIVIPPPNVTGSLHMGHALNNTVQDVLVRRSRMMGIPTLWVPGTDHAGIATQNVVEKELLKKGKKRDDLGKEKFIERVWEWKEKYGHIIIDQLKTLGCSCDWTRERFTMDEGYVKAVNEAFTHYYKKGWIYQGERCINWCPRCSTSLSDLEILYQEEKAFLYYIKYGPLTIATVRPETKLGDTAVAVNPKDKRYQKYIGREIKIETVLGPAKMRVIADESVDTKFGTGAMKVTPAHDLHDFELGEKYNLPKKQVIGPDGKMTKLTGKYAGLSVSEARKQITEDMKKIGILEKVEPYTHNVAVCYRCNTVLGPILSKQWFLKMSELVKPAIKVVEEGKIKFTPTRWKKVYLDWLKNIHDWCISRQIWWGHKIPIEGETDVLDTWFSSSLWPFAVFGWPQKTKNLDYFYPTTVLSTARDIIYLWVARMVFSGLELTGKIPFSQVYIHPTIFTKEGKRMSKSLGTGVDPLELIEKYGADATRFGLMYLNTGTQDIKFSEEAILAARNFCNKLWNASRFVLSHQSPTTNDRRPKTHPDDQWILKQLEETIKSVNADIDHFRFGQVTHTLYDFFWHDFCDKYLETTKSRREEAQPTLLHVLETSLKLLHPFMPFITEEIYQMLPNHEKSLMIADWPK